MNRQRRLVEVVAARGVRDDRVLTALARLDRADFVPAGAVAEAYDDAPVRLPQGQTTSQPSLIAAMVEALQLRGGERVLEVGAGYGYQTALLADLAAEVVSIEVSDVLARAASANLEDAGVRNVRVVVGDGTKGVPDAAPFDGIVVSAAFPEVAPAWSEQLREGGRLVVPIGHGGAEEVVVLRKSGAELVQERVLTAARFVPGRRPDATLD